MEWYELYPKEREPSNEQIREYVNSPLWDGLDDELRREYNVKPKASYSGCGMDGGSWMDWNVKYKKSGKALCSLYPKQGYFTALIAIGAKEQNEADLLIPLCCEYTQNLYNNAKPGYTGKSLAFTVTNEEILNDMKKLIALRAAAGTAAAGKK